MHENTGGSAIPSHTDPSSGLNSAAAAPVDSPVRRISVLVIAIVLSALVFRATIPFVSSTRGVVGPTIADAGRPALAVVAVVIAFAVTVAISALVARLVNSIVGVFALGCGVGYLAMRSGNVADFAFAQSSIRAGAIELVAWTALVAAGCHFVFKVGGALPDVPATGEDDLDAPAGKAARGSWLTVIAGIAVAAFAAASITKGQAIGAAVLAGFVTGGLGRMFAPRTTPVYLAAVPVAAMALVYLFYGFTVPADLAESFVGGSLPRILRIMPLDAVAGSLCGTALGFGFMRSFAIPQED